MATLQDLMEHTPDPRIDRVRGYLDRGKSLAQALYSGLLRSIPQPEGAGVEWDGEAGQYTGYSQKPEETAYNTLAWLMPTGSVSEAAQFAREGFKPGTLRAITSRGSKPTKYELAHQEAQRNAALPVEQGGLGLPPDNTAMDRARAMGFDTEAFHATGADIAEFKPTEYRKASFFAGTPQGAAMGRRAGIGDMTATGSNENILPVMLRTSDVSGLSYTPQEEEILSKIAGQLSEQEVDAALNQLPKNWYSYFDEAQNGDSFSYSRKPSFKQYKDAQKEGTNIYGERIGNYADASGERWAADHAKSLGKSGFLQNDEAGLSIAMTDPKNIRSRFAAFDPKKKESADLLASLLMGGIGLSQIFGETEYGGRDRY